MCVCVMCERDRERARERERRLKTDDMTLLPDDVRLKGCTPNRFATLSKRAHSLVLFSHLVTSQLCLSLSILLCFSSRSFLLATVYISL